MIRPENRFRELCAGHVLGTLTEDERWELDELLATASPEMLADYDELEVAALHLPAGAEIVEPPPEVRARLLKAVRAEKRIVSEEGVGTEPRGRPEAGAGKRPARWFGLARPRVALAAFAALAAVAIGLGLYSASLYRAVGVEERRAFNLAEDLQQKDRLLEVLQSKQVEVVVLNGLDLSPEGHGKLIWDQENQVAVLQVANLPPVPDDKVYQLWVFARDRDPTSAGVFAVHDPQRDAFFRFDGFTPVDRQSIRGYLITLESKGGTAAPSDTWYLGARVES